MNARGLQKSLELRFEEQTLAVYPANLAPPPWPYPFPMDREKGIAAYKAMISAKVYRARLARGETEGLAHAYTAPPESPVIRVEVSKVEAMSGLISKFEFKALDGQPLPEWTAGAHLDVVIAPDMLRQYSMSGDPANRSVFQIGVLREDDGRGGSKLLHRIFQPGRKIFVSKPINHFGLDQSAEHTRLMGGGIGVTPMIAMAHELWARGAAFDLHYSCRSRSDAAYLDDFAGFAWSQRVQYHFTDEGSRADLDAILGPYRPGHHVYTCGPDRYMNGVLEAATRMGYPEAAQHKEYFSVPEQPGYVNFPFRLKLVRSGRELLVPADKSATDVLQENGVAVDVKCSDGICGVCKCGVISGEVEHRDFVLSKAQREGAMILCQSRASQSDAVLEIDL